MNIVLVVFDGVMSRRGAALVRRCSSGYTHSVATSTLLPVVQLLGEVTELVLKPNMHIHKLGR